MKKIDLNLFANSGLQTIDFILKNRLHEIDWDTIDRIVLLDDTLIHTMSGILSKCKIACVLELPSPDLELVTRRTHDSCGLLVLISTIDKEGTVVDETRYVRNEKGKATRIENKGWAIEVFNSPEWSEYEYNDDGEETFYRNSEGFWRKTEYFPHNSKRVTSSEGQNSEIRYNEQGKEVFTKYEDFEVTRTYLPDGRPLAIDSTDGTAIRYLYENDKLIGLKGYKDSHNEDFNPISIILKEPDSH